MTKLQHVLAHAARGFRVFPVRTGVLPNKSPDKRPALNGWQAWATTNPKILTAHWTQNQDINIALALGAGAGKVAGYVFALDIDARGGKPGFATLRALEAKHGALPPTLTQRTASGGEHRFFFSQYPIKNSAGKLGAGLDVKGVGGYVIGAGSTYAGGVYQITADRPIANAPAWLIAACGSRVIEVARHVTGQAAEGASSIASSVPPVPVDAERARERAVHYLQHEAPLAVEGHGGDDTTYRVAARCKDFGADQPATLALMLEHWNPRCSPPWTSDDLNTKVANAYAYGTEPVGAAAPEVDFAPVHEIETFTKHEQTKNPINAPLPKDTRPPYSPDASRIGDVFTNEPARPRFIVENFYPVACGQEHSIGGAGKTTRRIWESLHIILGRPLYGRRILQPGPALVVTKEDGFEQFRYRLHHIALALNLSPAERAQVARNFHVLDMTGDIAGRLVAVDRAGNLIATDLAERIYRGYRGEGLAQVIFDPWNGFGPGERFVNDAEAALMVSGALISRELAANVCYVGHVSKEVGRKGIIDAHSGRGGAAMGDNARFVFGYVHHDPADPNDKKQWPVPAGAEQAAAQGALYRLHNVKQSYAKRITAPIWIERQGYAFRLHEGAPVTPEAALQDDGERVKRFVHQELEKGTKYTPDRLAEQRERYGLSRHKARQVIAWLQSNGGLIERPLPEAERRTKATHFLEPVFPAVEALGTREELFGDDAA